MTVLQKLRDLLEKNSSSSTKFDIGDYVFYCEHTCEAHLRVFPNIARVTAVDVVIKSWKTDTYYSLSTGSTVKEEGRLFKDEGPLQLGSDKITHHKLYNAATEYWKTNKDKKGMTIPVPKFNNGDVVYYDDWDRDGCKPKIGKISAINIVKTYSRDSLPTVYYSFEEGYHTSCEDRMFTTVAELYTWHLHKKKLMEKVYKEKIMELSKISHYFAPEHNDAMYQEYRSASFNENLPYVCGHYDFGIVNKEKFDKDNYSD